MQEKQDSFMLAKKLYLDQFTPTTSRFYCLATLLGSCIKIVLVADSSDRTGFNVI